MNPPPCPSCGAHKHPGHYLCNGCWFTLLPAARRALRRADGIAAARRLGELLDQLKADVPLHKVAITP